MILESWASVVLVNLFFFIINEIYKTANTVSSVIVENAFAHKQAKLIAMLILNLKDRDRL